MVECGFCKRNTHKRGVVKRKPLKDITDKMLPHPDVKTEFLCLNEIKILRPVSKDINGKNIYKWFDDICEGHVVILNIQ